MLILLTGGSGMVGRNLLEHPSSQSHELIAPTSTELDLCDLQATKDYLNKLRPDFVVHAAASPAYEFISDKTTGISAPPIGITIKMPMRNESSIMAPKTREFCGKKIR